jgi:hypothetical protein
MAVRELGLGDGDDACPQPGGPLRAAVAGARVDDHHLDTGKSLLRKQLAYQPVQFFATVQRRDDDRHTHRDGQHLVQQIGVQAALQRARFGLEGVVRLCRRPHGQHARIPPGVAQVVRQPAQHTPQTAPPPLGAGRLQTAACRCTRATGPQERECTRRQAKRSRHPPGGRGVDRRDAAVQRLDLRQVVQADSGELVDLLPVGLQVGHGACVLLLQVVEAGLQQAPGVLLSNGLGAGLG